MSEINSPDILFQLANWGLTGNDLVVKLVSIDSLGKLAGTTYEEKAIDFLFDLTTHDIAEVRMEVAKALANFDNAKAKAALTDLRNDTDYRVIGATLEKLFSMHTDVNS